MQAELLMEGFKVILLLLMFGITGAAVYLTSALNNLIRPISRQLVEMHIYDEGMLNASLQTAKQPRLRDIRERYIALLSHVDNINTAEFSSG